MYNENHQEVIQNIIQISVLLFVCVQLHLHRRPCSEAEAIFEDISDTVLKNRRKCDIIIKDKRRGDARCITI